uniref:Plasma membrane fusion protein PRM1 n=1 Tax=Physcomitrium patens TaxID=3218 RepID=A0A7I4ASV8_PHYPA
MSLKGMLLVCLLYLGSQPQYVRSSCVGLRRRLGAPFQTHFPIASDDSASERQLVYRRELAAANTPLANFRSLAPRDDRLDPFDYFNHYRGGYDIKSKHYWGSVAFTGIPGYAIAAAWLVLGLLDLLALRCCCCRCLWGWMSSKASKWLRSRAHYCAPRTILSLLSTISVAGCVVLFVACQKFTSQASNVEDVLVKAALDATNDIHSITGTLHEVKHSVLHYDRQLYQTLNSTATKLDSIAVAVNEKTFVTKKIYQKVLTIVEVVLLVVASLDLLLILLGFASTFLKWRCFFHIIVVTWTLTALTWIMFGFFLTVHYIADDTCLAFKEYLQHPQDTTIDDLLPCANLASSDVQFLQMRKAMKYCLEDYPFFVNQSTYDAISALTRALQSILDAFPLMEGLTNCSLVLNPIKTVVNVRCDPAKIAINRVWIAFAVVSSTLVLLIISWCLANHQNSEQRHLNSVAPHQSPPPPPSRSSVQR